MKMFYLTTATLLCFQLSFGQTQIENGNFEQWENLGNNTEEPTQWSSLKTSTDNSILNLANQAPQVLWQESNNPHSGSYCMRLKVASYNALAGLSPNAIATNGRVFASTTPSDAYVYTETSDNKWNTICADKPDSLIGWYKYAPQSNDKGKVEVLFHTAATEGKLPENGSTSHWVGTGITEFTTAKSSWTRFSFPINYTSVTAPNYFLIVATAGDGLNAVTDSELWIDDMAFVYNPPPVSIEELTSESHITVFNNTIKFDLNKPILPTKFNLFSIDGKVVWSSLVSESTLLTPNLNSGIYIYNYSINGKMYSGKVVF